MDEEPGSSHENLKIRIKEPIGGQVDVVGISGEESEGDHEEQLRGRGDRGGGSGSTDKFRRKRVKEPKIEKGMPPPGIQSGGLEVEAHFVLRTPPAMAEVLKDRLRESTMDEVLSVVFHGTGLESPHLPFPVQWRGYG